MNCPICHRLIECWVFLHSVERMSLDSWALGCPGSGNILFHRRMSFFFKEPTTLLGQGYGFCWWWRQHCHRVCPAPLIFSYCCINIFIAYWYSTFINFTRAWDFCFRILRLIRAHGVLLRLAAEYSAAMCGVCPGTLVTWTWLRLSMLYCCAMRPWSQICVMCQSCWFLG